MLSANPNIFGPDYQSMSMERTRLIYQELMDAPFESYEMD
jgi:hypothetical protein